jgi:hypothetical protein
VVEALKCLRLLLRSLFLLIGYGADLLLLGGETLDEGPVRDAALLGCPAVVKVDEEVHLLEEVLSAGVGPIVH